MSQQRTIDLREHFHRKQPQLQQTSPHENTRLTEPWTALFPKSESDN
ncbi:hypothetical protein [Dongshaea marina]|nr:hypothetical protein [Dongshaea marina]